MTSEPLCRRYDKRSTNVSVDMDVGYVVQIVPVWWSIAGTSKRFSWYDSNVQKRSSAVTDVSDAECNQKT